MAYSQSHWKAWLVRNDAFVFPIGVALVMRVLLSGFASLIVLISAHPIRPNSEVLYHGIVPLAPMGLNLLAAPFQRWDVIWYEVIATRGYSSNDLSTAFFPLYPLVTRLLMVFGGGAVLTGLIVSTVAVAAAFILFYNISQQLYDRRSARLGLIAWAVFPTSFFLFAPYAEGLFVLCALASLEAARRKNWLVAGLVGGLAGLTRSPGAWLLVSLGIEWLSQARTMAWKTRVFSFLPLALVPLEVALYMLYLQLAFGDAFLWLRALAVWETSFIFPTEALFLTGQAILFGDPGFAANNIVDLGTALFVLALVLVGTLNSKIRLPLVYIAYGLLFTLLPLGTTAHASNFDLIPLGSTGRRIMVVFPAFIVAGVLLNKGRLFIPIYMAIAFGLQLVLMYVFVNWLWVD